MAITYMAEPTEILIKLDAEGGIVCDDARINGVITFDKITLIEKDEVLIPFRGSMLLGGDGKICSWGLIEIPFKDQDVYYFQSLHPHHNDLLRWVCRECFNKPDLGDALVNFNNGELQEWHRIVPLLSSNK